MDIWQAIVLGVVEGITEFLPISSTGHLTIFEKLFGLPIDDPGVTAFTAIIQIGAIFAVIYFLRKDITRVLAAWLGGLFNPSSRNFDYRFGWAVIIGSIPIGIVGLLFKDQIETSIRSLWIVAIALIGWSGVIWLADKYAKQNRHERSTNWRDTLFIGVVQCLALIPGVSRSGATMSAGLFRGFDRVAVTRLSFFLSIPALLAAGALEAATRYQDISNGVGWTATIIATVVSFMVAYISVAWLLRYISKHSYSIFVIYRIALGALLVVLLATGTIAAT
jgi:undecaprenyl-diphosphatase